MPYAENNTRLVFAPIMPTLAGLLVFLLLLNSHLSAQEADSYQWSAKLAGSLINDRVIDRSFSSIPYQGSVPGISLGLVLRKKSMQELEFSFRKGDLETKKSGYSLQKTHLSLRYFYLVDLLSNRNKLLKCYLGPGVSGFSAERDYANFINKNSSYENALSLNASFQVSLNLNRFLSGVSLSNKITVPVISSIQQPAFDTELSPGQISEKHSTSNLFSDREFAGFKKYFYIKNSLNVAKRIFEHHELAFSYSLEDYKFKSNREVHQASRGFSLCYTYQFTQK